MGKLDGKVAFITGAGSGMGKAQAILFAKEGAQVIAADINFKQTEKVVEQIKAEGGDALAISLDVSNEEEVCKAIKKGLDQFNKIDILCNTAGIFDGFLPSLEVSSDFFDKIIGVNLKGPVLLTNAVLPQMLERGNGTIINIVSVAGITANGGGTAYTISKHGLVGYTKQLSTEYGPKGIKVNAIAPGAILTNMTKELFENDEVKKSINSVPAARYGEPEEIASASLFLASSDSDFVHGSILPVDGGWLIK
ncbi:glucose 1-dehydrogenase [Bacillus sp. B15-48]|uniref:SDR family NAD(P)-dependent oxidoreductase n=1 Tax=Bacillus sp. B15-48 TaxID=1548601 RepID=UPI00193F910F|nr:glucose 1-dehydrogenase [Bacillus sp. B15-48]MBM4763658.1 glucose 1-dehydrogenase [Bacillus sp. B15-48]